MDELAKRLGMDPVEIRMKNIFVEGDVSYWGERLHAVGLKETLIKATAAIEWGKKTQPNQSGTKIGKGFACIQKPTRSPTTSNAGVLVNSRGEVTVLAGTVEIGQGCNTILSQVAAEELKVPMDKVFMHPLDTDAILYDASTTSSRSTYHMGNAVRRAAIHARQQIAEAASPMLEANVQDLDFAHGKVFLKDQSQMALPIGEVVRRKLGTNGVVRGATARMGPKACVSRVSRRHALLSAMPSPMPWEIESTICCSNRKTSIGPCRTKRKKTPLKLSLSNFLNFSSNIQKPLLTGVTLRSVVACVFGGLRESKFEELRQ